MNYSQEQADKLTIGRFLARLSHNNYYCTNTGEYLMASSFLEYAGVKEEDKIHHLMKLLTTASSYDVQLMLLQYLITGNTDRSFVTDYVHVAKGDAFCYVRVCRNMDKANTNTLSPVISKYAHCRKDFVVIKDLESVRKGAGASLMHELLQKLNRPCLIEVKPIHDGEIELSESCDDVSKRIVELISYFKSLGFSDITDLYDSEDLCIMLYDNFDEPKKIYL